MNAAPEKTKIQIDLMKTHLENAEKIIRTISAWSPRSERKIQELIVGLAGMVERYYVEAWSLASVPLKHSGMGDEMIEEVRLSVLRGCWAEVVTTVGPEVEIVDVNQCQD